MADLQRLRVLRAVVQAGSINRAAARLGYTPSAVSQQISALQRETGLTLIERHGRGIVPTAAGRAVADRAGRVLEQLTDLDALTDDLKAGRSGTLRIECFMSANRAWMPDVVAALDEFSDLRIEIGLAELKGQRSIDPDLQLYIAESVTAGHDPTAADGEPDGYVVEHLLTEEYRAVMFRDHPLARRHSLSIQELTGEAWIDNDHARGPCREIVLVACREAGFSPRFKVAAPDYATAFDYVAAGLGVTVVPRLGAYLLPAGTVAVPVSGAGLRRRIMLRFKRSMRNHPAVQRATDILRQRAAEAAASSAASSAASATAAYVG
ncbi:LysR family transcriptional regulator [Microbacterium sp. HD4P20]|uniref:LysR family transcriptional regulator n=1 Tax=Microbacterium sp. HD4P20 TaxID=2864874 RepID=UPI001C64265A|nr:LysR family transcriptional regulator [Microbacterium sp. HD4P20]MCP2635025.1 LysR family transcriptional regulator [Microbacterium sp. HD4P20]